MSTSTERCLFCRIIAGEIPAKKVFQDSEVVAFEDINPQAPTHMLVIPRRHIASLNDLAEGDAEAIGKVLLRAAALARENHLHGDGYRVVINHGPGAGQSVFHIHAHLLGGRRFHWPPG